MPGARYTRHSYGGATGLDYRGPDNHWALGAEVGYDRSDVTLRERASSADGNGWHVGAYGRFGSGGTGFSASISGGYARSDAKVERTVTIGALSRSATARVDVGSWSVGAAARYGFSLGDGWSLGPQARIVHASARLDRFAEAGADSLDLSGASGNDDSRTSYGGGLFARRESARGFVDASISYAGGQGTPAETSLAMAGAPGTPFRVRAARGGGDGAEIALAGGLNIGRGWSIGATAQSDFGSRERSLEGEATIAWRF